MPKRKRPLVSGARFRKEKRRRYRQSFPLPSPVKPPAMASPPAVMSAAAAVAREHVERIRRERFFIGRGEQNPLAEDMHHAVTYLSQELYSKDVHFLMELVQVSKESFLHPIGFSPFLFGTLHSTTSTPDLFASSATLLSYCILLVFVFFTKLCRCIFRQ
jgi:hypothetical protein